MACQTETTVALRPCALKQSRDRSGRQSGRGDSSAIYIVCNGWSGNVNFTLPWPGNGKNCYRVTGTVTWNENPNAVATPGAEAWLGGDGTSYGLQGRSVLLLLAK